MKGSFWLKLENHPYKNVIGLIIGLGSLILGILFWLYPIGESKKISNKETPPEKVLYQPIFDIVDEIVKKETTLEKQEESKKFIGLTVEDEGQVADIINDEMEGKISIELAAIDRYDDRSFFDAPKIQCNFRDTWKNTLASIKAFEKIKFKGTILRSKNYNSIFFAKENTPFFFLDDCEIIK